MGRANHLVQHLTPFLSQRASLALPLTPTLWRDPTRPCTCLHPLAKGVWVADLRLLLTRQTTPPMLAGRQFTHSQGHVRWPPYSQTTQKARLNPPKHGCTMGPAADADCALGAPTCGLPTKLSSGWGLGLNGQPIVAQHPSLTPNLALALALALITTKCRPSWDRALVCTRLSISVGMCWGSRVVHSLSLKVFITNQNLPSTLLGTIPIVQWWIQNPLWCCAEIATNGIGMKGKIFHRVALLYRPFCVRGGGGGGAIREGPGHLHRAGV